MKKLFALILALAIVFTLVACGGSDNSTPNTDGTDQSDTVEPNNSSDENGDDEIVIGMSIPQMANPWFTSVMNGAQAMCDKLGYKLVPVDAGYDVAKQVSDFENFANQGVDAVLACPIDSNALVEPVRALHDQDIIVVSYRQIIEEADAILTIDEYDYGCAIGENAAKWINEKLGGEAQVLIISQDNVEAVVRRGDGIQETIEKNCPNAEIVARQAGDNPEKGMKIAEDILQQYPGLNVITGNNDSGPLGAVEAVKAAGRDTEDFYVGGADATPEAIAKMAEEGSVYRATVDICPFGTGVDAVTAVEKFLKEGRPEEPVVSYFAMNPVWQEDVLNGWSAPDSLEDLGLE